jgi:hypothetical protein
MVLGKVFVKEAPLSASHLVLRGFFLHGSYRHSQGNLRAEASRGGGKKKAKDKESGSFVNETAKKIGHSNIKSSVETDAKRGGRRGVQVKRCEGYSCVK